MSQLLNVYATMSGSEFIDWLVNTRGALRPMIPLAISLSAGAVQADYMVDSTCQVEGMTPLGYLCVAAENVAAMLVDASKPAGASWSKQALRIKLESDPPTSCDLRISSTGGAVSWAGAGARTVVVQGFIGGVHALTAELDITITP